VAKPRNKVVDGWVYVLLRLIVTNIHCWPVSWSLFAASRVGDCIYYFDAKHRRRAIGNLTRSFPEKSTHEIRNIARRSMQNMCCLGVETFFTTRLIRLETYARHINLEHFAPTLDLMMKRDQGLIMLTGHYGNWEVLGYVLATLGFETTSVARPLDNPHLNQFLLGVRSKRGQRIIAKKGATEAITQALDERQMVAFIADQNAGPKGIFVDFFGRKASAYKSIGLLAIQYNIPVVIGYARRRQGDFYFDCGSHDVIYPADWKDESDPLRYITQRYTAAIEAMVRIDPTQYLWVHRRWKSRPKGETAEKFD